MALATYEFTAGPAVNSKLTIPVMLRSDWEDLFLR